MATRKYWILSDSNPAMFRQETDNRASALEMIQMIGEPSFVQQYVNGRMGKSWTKEQLQKELAMSGGEI